MSNGSVVDKRLVDSDGNTNVYSRFYWIRAAINKANLTKFGHTK